MQLPWQDDSELEAYCLPFIRGQKRPDSALDLMAARYVAYTTGAIDYLFATHDPKTRGRADRHAIESWSKRATWRGLEIREVVDGAVGDDKGEVEFIARYELDDTPHDHHERASFRRIDGIWFFVDGTTVSKQPIRRETPKQSRNDLCLCGSGKKYKRCCGAVAAR
jgi:SEC-C motif-containing protein